MINKTVIHGLLMGISASCLMMGYAQAQTFGVERIHHEKAERVEKAEKPEKTERVEKVEKVEKSEKTEKAEKPESSDRISHD